MARGTPHGSPLARAAPSTALLVVLASPLSLGELLDAMAGGLALVLGTCVTLVAMTLVGLAVWAAGRMRPSGLPTLFGRWALGGAGAAVLGLGLVLLGAGVEAVGSRPFGPEYTGSLSLLAWLVALHVSLLDSALSAVLAHRLAERTGEALHRLAHYWSVTVVVGAWALRAIVRAAVALVMLGMFLDHVM